jgi:hypothetical protein
MMRRRAGALGVIAGLACALLGSGRALAGAERVDLYDAQSRRAGYAIVDRRTGRVDLYDTQSRRLGYGVTRPRGSGIDFYRSDGQRWLGVRPTPGSAREAPGRGPRR